MTSSMVQDINQSVSFISDAQLNLPLQPGRSVASSIKAGSSAAEVSAVFFDTVSISFQSRQTVAGEEEKGLSPEVVKKEKAKKEEENTRIIEESSQRKLSKVQFVYNQRGDLIVKYMDASDRLVYQIPSDLMLFQKETALKVGASVDSSV
ncbi:MAG: hypothetical protein WCK54_14210 [Desulfuromonadales bacterium]